MKLRKILVASAAAIATLAAGCSSGSGAGAAKLPLEKTSLVVDAFPAIDSAGLYIAETDGLFAAQGLRVKIVPAVKIPPATQDLIDGQLNGTYDVTAGDYVSYIGNEAAGKARLLIIAEASFLQPNVLALLVNGGSPVSSVSQLKGKTVSVNAPDGIGTLLLDSVLAQHGLTPSQVKFNDNVPFPAVPSALSGNAVTASFSPEPFVSLDEQSAGVEELADLDQGSTEDFPIQGYAVTQAWATEVPRHAEGVHHGAGAGPGDRRHRPRRGGASGREVPRHQPHGRGADLAPRVPGRSRRRAAAARGHRDAPV